MIRWLTLKHIKDICFIYAQIHLTFDEPIPPFETRFPGRLESIPEIPRQEFEGRMFYPTLIEQAAVLFYSLIKGHPFLNGNKRMAIISLLTFLLLNKKWLRTSIKDLYDITVMVAESDPRERRIILKKLTELIEKSLIEAPAEGVIEIKLD